MSDTPTLTRDDGEVRAATRGVVSLAVLQTVGRAFGLSFALGMTLLVAAPEFGRYSTVSGLVLFGGFFADFGTSIAITRWISRTPADSDRVLRGTLLVSLGIGVTVYLAMLAFVFVAGYPHSTRLDALIAGLALPMSAVATSLFATLDGLGRLDRRAWLTFLQSGVVALGGLTVLALTGSMRWTIAMIPTGPLLAGIVAGSMLRRSGAWRSGAGFDGATVHRLLVEAVPYAVLGGIAALTLRFDLVFLSVVSNRAETAHYDLALRSIEALTYLGTVVAGPAIFLLTRRLTRHDHAGAQRALDQATRFSYLVGLPLSALVTVIATPAVRLLYGDRYTAVAAPLAILAAQLWLLLLVSLLGSAIIAAGLGRAVIPVSAAVAGVGIVLDVVLIPTHGAIGAAVAVLGTQVVAVLAFALFARRRAGLRLRPPSAGTLFATATALLAALSTRSLLGVGAAVLGAGVFMLTAIATRAIRRTDLDVVTDAFRARTAAGGGPSV